MVEKRYSAKDEAFNRAMMFPEEEQPRFTSRASGAGRHGLADRWQAELCDA
jgi:hypothetical protein